MFRGIWQMESLQLVAAMYYQRQMKPEQRQAFCDSVVRAFCRPVITIERRAHPVWQLCAYMRACS